jgi:hypothetical protein
VPVAISFLHPGGTGEHCPYTDAVISESIPLPDGVRLRADPLPAPEPPRWAGTRVRRRLVAAMVLSAVFFTGVAVTAAVAFSWAVIPIWGSHVHVPATVTSQYGYYKRDIYALDGHHCIIGLQYVLDGGPRTASSDTHTRCEGSPSSGSTVTISVYQKNTIARSSTAITPSRAFSLGASDSSASAGLSLPVSSSSSPRCPIGVYVR